MWSSAYFIPFEKNNSISRNEMISLCLLMIWISSYFINNYCYFSIYRQICDSSPPLHPVLPALLEVFVNSALVPASNRGSPDQTVNEPISEHEIRAVFQVRKLA